MNYRKMDAALITAVDEAEDREACSLEVFVHLDHIPDEEEKRILSGLGIRPEAAGRTIITASLSADDVAELTDQPWIRQIRLSQRLRFVSPERHH
jgi:hypothetical protein